MQYSKTVEHRPCKFCAGPGDAHYLTCRLLNLPPGYDFRRDDEEYPRDTKVKRAKTRSSRRK